jgi:hypothetical protein
MNFPPDRFEHALEAYAYFHGRECAPMDVARFFEADTLLASEDHLLGYKLDTDMIRLIGVVANGCTIVDMTNGPPTWALNKSQGRCDSRQLTRRRGSRLANSEGLDIPGGTKYQQG